MHIDKIRKLTELSSTMGKTLIISRRGVDYYIDPDYVAIWDCDWKAEWSDPHTDDHKFSFKAPSDDLSRSRCEKALKESVDWVVNEFLSEEVE